MEKNHSFQETRGYPIIMRQIHYMLWDIFRWINNLFWNNFKLKPAATEPFNPDSLSTFHYTCSFRDPLSLVIWGPIWEQTVHMVLLHPSSFSTGWTRSCIITQSGSSWREMCLLRCSSGGWLTAGLVFSSLKLPQVMLRFITWPSCFCQTSP